MGLCQRTGWDWAQASEFVNRVDASHRDELAGQARRSATVIHLTRIFDGILVFALGSVGILWPFFYNLRSARFMVPGVDYEIAPSVLMAFGISPVYFWMCIVIASIGIGLIGRGVVGIILAAR